MSGLQLVTIGGLTWLALSVIATAAWVLVAAFTKRRRGPSHTDLVLARPPVPPLCRSHARRAS